MQSKREQCINIEEIRALGGKYKDLTDDQSKEIIQNIHQISEILVKNHLNKIGRKHEKKRIRTF